MKTTTVTASASAGRCRTLSPKRRQTPWRVGRTRARGRRRRCPGAARSRARPKIVSSAGSSVRPATMPEATPIAATGPSVEVLRASARVRTSIASATVSPRGEDRRARRGDGARPSRRACPRSGAAPRGIWRRAAGSSRSPPRTSARSGSRSRSRRRSPPTCAQR